MKNVTLISVERTYQAEEKMYDEVLALVRAYAGQMATTSAIGVLELVKHELITNEG